jgi:cyclophilin family peptidyl-prolyl cis-trans isomerase
MVETRNEALMTLELWGDTIQSVKNFDSGLVWTPEQLASLPNESKYLMITTHDQKLDTIAFSVFKNQSPLTALHFANLVADHFYENKYFHRRVPNFVLQGGCPRGDGMGSLDFTIASEFSDSHFQMGSIGWASAGPHTESCQIFFMLDEAYTLDGRYTNMGSVTSGMEKLVHLPLGTQILRIENIN